jgi:hypothetical protein
MTATTVGCLRCGVWHDPVRPHVCDAIAASVPLGSVAFEGQPTEKGERVIYLDDRMSRRETRRAGETSGATITLATASSGP